MPKHTDQRQKYPPLPNKKGSAYAGRMTAPKIKAVKTELEEVDRAIAKFRNHIREFERTPGGISPIVPEHLARLMNRRASLIKELILQNLPETERKTYSADLDRHIESLHRLTDQLANAEANNILELVNLLRRHHKKLATRVQQLSLKNQPLGTPELGELPERPLTGPIKLDPLPPRPPPEPTRQRSQIRNLKRRGTNR